MNEVFCAALDFLSKNCARVIGDERNIVPWVQSTSSPPDVKMQSTQTARPAAVAAATRHCAASDALLVGYCR